MKITETSLGVLVKRWGKLYIYDAPNNTCYQVDWKNLEETKKVIEDLKKAVTSE